MFVSMPDLCFPQVGHDTVMHDADVLPDVQISARRNNSGLVARPNEIVMDLHMLDNMPKIMGNADPMRYVQSLPMVQTNNEYDSGLHVQGCDNGHNMLSIDGATIYNASHLLGIFSIFNASHYDKLSLRYSAQSASDPNRLGGHMMLYHSDTLDRKTGGTYTVGPMSSQGTIRFPSSGNSSVRLSLRASYLNLLYESLLRQDDYDINYFFDDINATFKYKPAEKDLLWFDLYAGCDRARYFDDEYSYDINLKWRNLMASAHWRHECENGLTIHQMAYFSHFRNELGLRQDNLNGAMPSGINDISYKSDISFKGVRCGLSSSYYHIRPQTPTITGNLDVKSVDETQDAQEYSAYAEWTHQLSDRLTLNAGVRGSFFVNPERKTYSALDPSLTVSAELPTQTSFSLSASARHQYLFYTGVSGMNLPIEFWTASFDGYPPQQSFNIDASVEQQLSDNGYCLQLRLFYKKLRNQIEYNGSLFDVVYNDFQLENHLIKGYGENYGFSVMVNKKTGRLTGFVSYTYTHARRTFEELNDKGSYPAAHERPHELTALAAYNINDRWQLGATYVIASGTPFTAPKSFHAYNMNVISTFGEYNANRLPAYSRLDLSVNYLLKKSKGQESGLNLSLYNVLYRANSIFYRLKFYQNEFAYKRMDFLIRILPSISFYHSF